MQEHCAPPLTADAAMMEAAVAWGTCAAFLPALHMGAGCRIDCAVQLSDISDRPDSWLCKAATGR